MRRREFVTVLGIFGGASAARPLAVRARESGNAQVSGAFDAIKRDFVFTDEEIVFYETRKKIA